MINRTSLIAAAALGACVAAAPLGAQSTTELERGIDSVAKAVLKATGVPSASVAVVRHGTLMYADAYGDAKLQPPTPATPDMRYAIGSISKQFTATAVLLLQQQGKLSLDDKVAKWIPGLTDGNQVTIRQILSHTSGYQDYWPQDYVPPEMERPTTPDAILARWAKRPLDFTPGSRWQYSNTNFVIAGLIVQKASGMPFFQFLRTNVLNRVGITSAVDFDQRGPSSVQPVGYLRYALGPLHPAPSTGPNWMFAAGELAMTASDLAKWDISIITQSLLSPASYHMLETTTLLNSGLSSGYGLGVDVVSFNGHRMIEHDGEVSGFTAENMVFPDDSVAVVVLTNQDAAPASGAIGSRIAQLLFRTTDPVTEQRTAQAKRIFEGLQKGEIDRSLFTPNANAYFSAQALADFTSSLGPLGAPKSFVQTRQALRGGMTLRSYLVTFANGKTVRAWTFETPDGKLEQYQVAPIG
ncbi:MAG TPA: serine hydrolase domain-containing protein [Gemmatimonadaceae bacterium]|nr:serine hydrolase domain-containing protein [Gemmatimonadaceae bacterium]